MSRAFNIQAKKNDQHEWVVTGVTLAKEHLSSVHGIIIIGWSVSVAQ